MRTSIKPRKRRVLLLVDLVEPPKEVQNYKKELKLEEDWWTESDVACALGKLGHEYRVFGVFDDIRPLAEEINSFNPHVVFNLCESFKNDRKFEPNLVALLELMTVPYTGADSAALRLCKDKAMTKEILSFHDVKVPEFAVSKKSMRLRSLTGFSFPAFVKPLGFEASEGISQNSYASNESAALTRLNYIHEKLGADAIVEEFIDGRELYVSVMGNQRLTVFPPREMYFRQMGAGLPKIATFKAKWDKKYRKKWGIHGGIAKLKPQILSEIERESKKVYRVLGIKGYARFDIRLKPNGEVFFIEVNPNPAVNSWDDFGKSARRAGWKYEALIEKLLNLAEGSP